MDLKPGVEVACAAVVKAECTDGDVWTCLMEKFNEQELPAGCNESVAADYHATNLDWVIGFHFSLDCLEEVQDKCEENEDCLEDIFTPHQSRDNPACQKSIRSQFMDMALLQRLRLPVRPCNEAMEKYCLDSPPGSGRLHKCLFDHRFELHEFCGDQHFTNPRLDGFDGAVVRAVQEACPRKVISATGCASGHGGNGVEVVSCIVGKMGTLPSFLKGEAQEQKCLRAVDLVGRIERFNFLLAPDYARHCMEDATALCAAQLGKKATEWKVNATTEGDVLFCLLDNRDRITHRDCQKSLWRMQPAFAPLAGARTLPAGKCAEDGNRMCAAEMKSGSASAAWLCLQAGLKDLTPDCRQTVESEMIASAAGDAPERIHNVCKVSAARLCGHLPPFAGRALRTSCLFGQMPGAPDVKGAGNVEPACQEELNEERAWRLRGLQYRQELKSVCAADLIDLLGAGSCGGHHGMGWKHMCLQKNMQTVKNERCRYLMVDLHNDMNGLAKKEGLPEQCSDDMRLLCNDIPAVGNSLLECIRAHEADIKAPSCRSWLEEYRAGPQSERVSDEDLTVASVRWACSLPKSKHCNGLGPLWGHDVVHCLLRRKRDLKDVTDDSCDDALRELEAVRRGESHSAGFMRRNGSTLLAAVLFGLAVAVMPSWPCCEAADGASAGASGQSEV